MSLKNKLFICLGIVALIAIDLVTKAVFIDCNFSVLGDLLWFSSTTNPNAAFSWFDFAGNQYVFLALATIVSAFCVFIIFNDKFSKSLFLKISLAVLIAGILGNAIDRIAFGYVRDFIYLKFINFATFNVADMCITISAVLIAVYIIFLHKDNEKSHSLKSDNNISVSTHSHDSVDHRVKNVDRNVDKLSDNNSSQKK